ncbi:FAD-dependent oxidoreductase [Mesorhizobium sp.]|uniref:NAD(P)/FAD-dependent oxidoreductase n=1 Tax=Mesorhizobium sp. TaxID=1871066 RepID=UPI0025BE9A33|nr:FAD-dependent oxidoreductase [Mesorhizobium sp.]
MRKKIVIIGGGQAGGRLSQLLAKEADSLETTLIFDEPYPPYERPPLSKSVIIGGSTLEKHLIWRPESAAWRAISIKAGVQALSINRDKKEVSLANGEAVAYDKCVIATGSSVRPLTVPGGDLREVLKLRTYEDALAVASRLGDIRKLLIIGGGFIGLEVASAMRSLGIDTRVVEASDRLLSRIVPRQIAGKLLERHRSAGVTFNFMTMVERFIHDRNKALKAAVLSNGETVECDLALVGVGVYPNVALGEEAGLEIEVGICTDQGLVTSDKDILACGDVASFWHPMFNRRIRVEAWQNAEDHAAIAAASLCGLAVPNPSVPFFWSDQYELSLQLMGMPHLGVLVQEIKMADGSVILVHSNGWGVVVGATGYGIAESIGREMRRIRGVISRSGSTDFGSVAVG